jgi:hypothetical protein
MKINEIILEAQAQLPQQVVAFLDALTPDDVGVDVVGRYRVHYEGFTDQCQTSSDYQNNPEKVFMEVWRDFIKRENNRAPVNYGMVGSEDYPILYAVFTTQ